MIVPTGWSDGCVGRPRASGPDRSASRGRVGEELADEARARRPARRRSGSFGPGQQLEDEEGDRREQHDGGDPGDPDDRARALVLVLGSSGVRGGRARPARRRSRRRHRAGRRRRSGWSGRHRPRQPTAGARRPRRLPAAAPRCGTVRDASSASAIAAAEAKRSIGSGARALRVIAARSGGIDGRTRAGSGTGPLRRASATAAALSPSHGRVPVSISYRTMPSAVDVGRVRRGLAASLLRAEVVDRPERRARAASSAPRRSARAMPKSTTLTRPSRPISTLPGFTSRWTMPRAWAAARARATAAGDPGGLGRRQRAVPPQDRGEVLAVDELHDDVRPRRVLAVVVDGDDVGVAQRRGVLRLLAEARARSRGRAGTRGGAA